MTTLQLKKQVLAEFDAVAHEIRLAISKAGITKAEVDLRIGVITRIIVRYRLFHEALVADAKRWGKVDQLAKLTVERQDYEDKFMRIKDLARWYRDGGEMYMTSGSPEASEVDSRELEADEYEERRAAARREREANEYEERQAAERRERDQQDAEDKTEEIERLKHELSCLRVANDQLRKEMEIKEQNEPPPSYKDVSAHVTFDPKVFSTPMIPIHPDAMVTEKKALSNFPSYPWEQERIVEQKEEKKLPKLYQDLKYDTLTVPPLSSDYEVKRNTNPFLPGPGESVNPAVETGPLLPGINILPPTTNPFVGNVSQYSVDDPVRYLTKIPLTKFKGIKKAFHGWWSAFSVCVDQTSLNPNVKLLKLLDCLEGEPKRMVEELGISPEAYEVAKERLQRKYGGAKRQLAMACEDVNTFKPIRDGVAADLERLAELLDRLVVNLKNQGEEGELGSGFLYNGLQKKLTPTFLSRFHRWLHDRLQTGTVLSLRTYVNEEAEFLTTASESIIGFGQSDRRGRRERGDSRTMFTQSTGEARSAGGASNGARPRECRVCKKPHGVWECAVFKKMPVKERNQKVKELRICYKCLGYHGPDRCWRKRPCTKQGCGKPHHVLLHDDSYRQQSRHTTEAASQSAPPIPPRSQESGSHSVEQTKTNMTVTSGRSESPCNTEGESISSGHTEREHTNTTCVNMLRNPTMVSFRVIPVLLSNGRREIRVNALLDDASNRSYISEKAASFLHLRGEQTTVSVQAVTTEVTNVKSRVVTCLLTSENGNIKDFFTAKTLPSISDGLPIPNMQVEARQWDHLRDISFPKPAGSEIDILIGLDYLDWMVGEGPDVRGRPGEPVARKTPLGWTCVAGSTVTRSDHTHITIDMDQTVHLNKSIQRFWELEEIPKEKVFTHDEKKALELVKKSITKVNGRYCVGVPWRNGRPTDINNFIAAFKRLRSTENKLLRYPELGRAYQEVFDMYLRESIIRKVLLSDVLKVLAWFLPHFPVVRREAATTKTRPVFDASAEYMGLSLNDLMYPGPKLQNDLVVILLRFRRYAVALACDIAKMYLQILLLAADQPFFYFLWRNLDQSREPEVYAFNRVVFGANSSPFLAQYVARVNAESFLEKYPEAANMILNSTYMDDTWDSVPTEEEGIRMVKEVREIWKAAMMNPHKWLSNSQAVLDTIPMEERGVTVNLSKYELPPLKALGCGWDPVSDMLIFTAEKVLQELPTTKRGFLKVLATIFDPLGLLAPVVIEGKILMQRCWYEGADWDAELPRGLQDEIHAWIKGLEGLKDVSVPRVLIPGTDYIVTLHMCGDASGQAFGAVVFSVAVSPAAEAYTNVIASKSRVAPLSAVSLPRLELEAAVLGANLMTKVSDVLEVSDGRRFYWTDSMDVLFWIHSRSRDHKPYVAHRIGEIQRESMPSNWDYIPTKENPADVVSRGMSVSQLLKTSMWWKGAEFFTKPKAEWPSANLTEEYTTKERRKNITLFARSEEGHKNERKSPRFVDSALNPERWSNLNKLLRVTVYVLRAVDKLQKNEVNSGGLKGTEIEEARLLYIEEAQAEMFPGDLRELQKSGTGMKGSVICFLKPWLDEFGLIRADSRLTQSGDVPWETKYPIILPKRSAFTRLLVQSIHEDLGHAGAGSVLSEYLKRYFTIGVRELINSVITACYKCKRWRVKPEQPPMAPLPVDRVTRVERPFTRVSLDFAGPYLTKAGRGRVRNKRYLCVYGCMTTRGVHLEMVGDLTTQSFLMALTRIVARRGRPRVAWSDNGSNLVGGREELDRLDAIFTPGEIETKTCHMGIDWKFNPPRAPHFNGLHEVLVRGAKRALKHVLPGVDFTDEELRTALCDVERMMNNRPLTYQSSDPRDTTVLTPNHFIMGQICGPLVAETGEDWEKDTRLRWRYVEGVLDRVWKRWLEEWITGLSARKKWFRESRNLRVDDVVLIADTGTPRGEWPLGRVLKVFPGPDGVVRVIEVECQGKVMKRPAVRACLLVEKI